LNWLNNANFVERMQCTEQLPCDLVLSW